VTVEVLQYCISLFLGICTAMAFAMGLKVGHG